jgi:hypothetical protein
MRKQAHHNGKDKTKRQNGNSHTRSTHRCQQEQNNGNEEDEYSEEDNTEASEVTDAGYGVKGY